MSPNVLPKPLLIMSAGVSPSAKKPETIGFFKLKPIMALDNYELFDEIQKSRVSVSTSTILFLSLNHLTDTSKPGLKEKARIRKDLIIRRLASQKKLPANAPIVL